MAQLHLVLVLPHQLQLRRVAVLQVVEESLRSNMAICPHLLLPMLDRAFKLHLAISLGLPLHLHVHLLPLHLHHVSHQTRIKGAQMYLSLEVGGEWLLARGIAIIWQKETMIQ